MIAALPLPFMHLTRPSIWSRPDTTWSDTATETLSGSFVLPRPEVDVDQRDAGG